MARASREQQVADDQQALALPHAGSAAAVGIGHDESVTTDPGLLDDPEDAAALVRHAAALADAIDVALVGWVERCVGDRWVAWSAQPLPPDVAAAAAAAGARALAQTGPALRALLATDVDAQRANPLAIIREAVVHPTEVLVEAGVPPVARDPQAERLFPEDVYDLSPASFADLHPSVHEPGLVWGAAKAHVILRRRRAGR